MSEARLETSPRAGVHEKGTLIDHEGRAAARRLLGQSFDAWDDRDAVGFAEQFAVDAVFEDRRGLRVSGREAILRARLDWTSLESFSLHWFSNIDTQVTPDGLRSTGLWSSAATDRDGRAFWSGGDLTASVVLTSEGWRLSSLRLADRYRTSYSAGWLLDPASPWPVGEQAEDTSRTMRTPTDARPAPSGARPASSDPLRDRVRAELLVAEHAVENLSSEMTSTVATGAAAEAVAQYFHGDAVLSLRHVDRGDVESIVGSRAIADRLVDEALRVPTLNRLVLSVTACAKPDGSSVTCDWRDLWTATVEGKAHWMAHRYRATAVRHQGAWRFGVVSRARGLDCAYRDGWG